MMQIIQKLQDLVEAAKLYDRAVVNEGKKVSEGGKVYVGREVSGERGTVIFIPEEEGEE